MRNKEEKHIGIHYLLTEIRLCTLTLQEVSNYVKDKSITHNVFKFYMFGFCYIVFTEYMEKLCSSIPIYFHLLTIKRIAR